MASFTQLEIPAAAAAAAGVILKHIVGKGVRGLANYAASKATDINGITTNKPIYANTSDAPRLIAKEFGFLRRLRPKLNKAVGHLIIAPKSKFQTQADWEKAANIAMKEHGIENTAFACYLHTDTEHPHLHIVYSRIRFDGSVVSDSNSYRTNERAARKIESSFGIPPLQTRPRENQPIDSQRPYSAERREQRVEAKIQRKDQENARKRYITHAPEKKPNRRQLRKTSEIGVRQLQPRPLANNRDAEFKSVLPDNERTGGREFGSVRWGTGYKYELIGITPTPTPAPKPKKRRMKMTTQNEFQKIQDVIKRILNDPAVDSPVEFKRCLDAALAEAEIEALARFHRRGKDDDAEISGWSLMFSQGTSVAASNISRSLSWAHVLAELNANAARRRRRNESAALAEEALGFLLLRPAQAIPAQGEEAPLTPRRARVGDGDQDEPVPGPSWSWPAAAVDGIYETRDALAIRPNLIDRLSPAELDRLVFKLCDRAEKKWGGDALQAEGLLVDHPQLFAALVNEAAQRPGLCISRPPKLVAAIEVARAARAGAAGAGLSPARPQLDFLSFSPAPVPTTEAEAAPAPKAASPAVVPAPAPLTVAEAEKAKTASLVAELRTRVAHARRLFSSPVPAVMSAFQLERLDAPALRARLVELEGSTEQADWIAGVNVRHESEQHTLGGVAAERVLQAFEAAAPAGRPRGTFVARGAALEAAQALKAARASRDQAGPFRWLAAASRKSEIQRLEALARSSKTQWEHAKSEFLQEHAQEIQRFEARQALFLVESGLRTARSGSGSFETNAGWTPEVLAVEKQKILDRLAVAERREQADSLRQQERDRMIERERSGAGADSQEDEDRQVRYERQR